jgi:hypothetical protein
MKTKLLLFLFTFILVSCSKDQNNGSTSSQGTISISNASYKGGYNAVWFNSTSGLIKAVGADPDESYGTTSDYKFWVEPGDREFTADLDPSYGVVLLGNGDDIFTNATRNSSLSGFSTDINKSDWTVGNVFYIRVPKGDCVIQFIDFNVSDNSLKFNWKKL